MTSTSIRLTWTSAGSEAVIYEVQWTYDGECAGINGGSASAGIATGYTIEGLEESSTYSITVKATNPKGNVVSNLIAGATSEAGKVTFQC